MPVTLKVAAEMQAEIDEADANYQRNMDDVGAPSVSQVLNFTLN